MARRQPRSRACAASSRSKGSRVQLRSIAFANHAAAGQDRDDFDVCGDRRLTFIEAKASRTITPAMAEPMRRLRHAARAYRVSGVVIHRSGRYPSSTSALDEGMTTVPVEQFPEVLSVTRQRSDS